MAPPGAGKTTLAPLALLDAPWLAGKRIIVLEPRRLAARAAASRMAGLLGEKTGQTVGYRIRLDTQVSQQTRIEVVTEGVLIRLLQDDPELTGIGLIIFDEFHERSLQCDLGLALALEARAALRPDLGLLVMSATIAAEPVAALLDNAPILTGTGFSHPVITHYLPPAANRSVLDTVASIVIQALAEEPGSILVFLPGTGEISRVAARLAEMALPENVLLVPLFGNLSQQEQDLAISPCAPGLRKIVLATSIAETSLTIEGIRVVIDCGLMRTPRFDPTSGMTRLETIPVSRASADQRRGRAGRTEPGACYRLWSRGQHAHLKGENTPEIMAADLASLALELALWGVTDPDELIWLDPPPPGHYRQAQELLRQLEALDKNGKITSHGRRMALLAMHPRLAHMTLKAATINLGPLACDLAALLGERDLLCTPDDPDIRTRLEILGEKNHPAPHYSGVKKRIQSLAATFRRSLNVSSTRPDPDQAGLLLSFAYPDRIAQKRPGQGKNYLLANGRGAFLAADSFLDGDFLVAAALDGRSRQAKIFLAAPVSLDELKGYWGGVMTHGKEIFWDSRSKAVLAKECARLGALVIEEKNMPLTGDPRTVTALISGIRELGISILPWTRELRTWQARVLFLASLFPEEKWPDPGDAALAENLEEWLAPFLAGLSRAEHLAKIDLGAALTTLISWQQQKKLENLAPTHITVPSGSRIRLDYHEDGTVVLPVKIQEIFGLTETPAIAGGRARVLLHLLSPARRPVQVTQDLHNFWKNGYPEVRKELRARYARHEWPEDPLAARPTARAKRKK